MLNKIFIHIVGLFRAVFRFKHVAKVETFYIGND